MYFFRKVQLLSFLMIYSLLGFYWNWRAYDFFPKGHPRRWEVTLKWYYDENRIFPIAAILKHKQVACVRRKMLFTVFKYLFSFQRYSSFKICKLAQWWRHTFNQILIKYDEKRYLSQFESEMFDSLRKILLNVLHNMSLTVWLPWQHTGFQTSPILKAFLATFGVSFWYLQMVPHMLDLASI